MLRPPRTSHSTGGGTTLRSSGRRRYAGALIVAAATTFGAAACSSSGSSDSPVVSTSPSPAPTGGCGALTNLMRVEQVVIHDLQVGRVSGPTAEATITGVNGQLAHAAEQAGRTSILGIALTQLVSENGTLSQALNQSVPVGNLNTVIGSINQDITNVENNCHQP
jgi:hypothetical protein